MKSMKICFLASASSIHTVRWVNAMSERGHDVYLLTIHRPKEQIHSRVHVIKLPFPPPMGYYLNFPFAKRCLNKIKPDLLNTHYASGYGTLSRLLNFNPTLLSVWGSDVFDFPYQSRLKYKIIVKNLNAATQIASTSKVMKNQVEKLVTPRLPIVITPFGVDINFFKPNLMKKNKEVIQIGMVKKLEEKYGPKYLIQAVAILKRKLIKSGMKSLSEKIRLLIVGDGSQYDELIMLSKELEISDITRFTGAVPHSEVPKYLSEIDIFCAPSTLDSESFGVAVVEASACGIPVVASNVGGLPEVIRDNETGFLVEPKNSMKLAEKLFKLVIDENLRKEMGYKGREFIKTHYNWDDNVKKMESIYLELINGKS